ncbi:MAG TPA: enoyl-CoA hydratase-related protein [Polyangiaceae bacterium LLY-WYZ-15_(1-7)]|nr:enoyl-CoA hydratase [Sandaracinus sp.]HJL06225.1 enoyl-CoA hydratase-related protein [Polyangiaceae bacterium LLY-WYZ-15_(1-7)]MBJ72202.1 enoyl-CoA hydratase [Sandaracinus sp.]HJL10880.1 enoyl-CoA hydratase-related protein [Polyangiaceae bacterium LLY-WYZ-15_(1-7)]HJL26772.1 enoyl-CoA hydratase-related protein [Polyangiaceae bacterium LLY-WYZ-15_(1-7)]
MSQPEAAEHGVRVETRGALAIWTLDRPERMNALSRATVRELGRLARAAAEDDSVRAVILTGAGDRAFCAGADLKERKGMDEEDVRDFLGLYRAAFDAIDRLPKPTVAAINGVAFGGGLEVALACDLRVMASTAKVGLTEVSLAIIPGAGGTQRLTRIVGPAKAKELILLARRLEAEEAQALGIVNRVAAEGQGALECALELCAPFENAAPIAVAAALDAIDGATDLDLDAGLLHERRCYERTLASQDRLEALAAFREKRPPVYRGE